MKVSLVIPTYNSEKNLRKNLPQVLKVMAESSSLKPEVIITDDASVDLSINVAEMIANEYRGKLEVKVIQSSEGRNKGFSTNVNKGVDATSGDIVVLLNSDVYPEKGFIDSLISHFNDEKVFAVGCLEKSIEQGREIDRGRGIGSWRKGFLVHSAGDLSGLETLWVAGGSGAFRKSLWDKLGGLDTLYNPFYWEDIDLSYRARKAGYKTLFERKSVVKHNHDEGVIRREFTTSEIIKVAYRNQYIFAWKNADSSNLLKNYVFIPYNFLGALLRRDWQFFSGFFTALIKLPKIVRSRIRSKKLWSLSDAEVTNTK